MQTVKCHQCNKDVEKYPSQIKKYKKQFCNRVCKSKWNKTVVGYWKGRKMGLEARQNMSSNHADVSGSKNPRWKGGKRIDKDGYILIWNKEHPNCDYHGYVREHRLVIEDKIERYLSIDEIVHHKDANKQNNKIENLELYENNSKHQKEHYHNLKTSPLKHAPTP